MQAVTPQADKKEAPAKKLDALFEAVPKGVKLTAQIDEIAEKMSNLQKQYDFLVSKEKESVIADINAKIAKLGIRASELDFGVVHTTRSKSSMAGSKVAIKYKLGQNVWTGRGRKPKWLEEHIASGGKIEDTLVK